MNKTKITAKSFAFNLEDQLNYLGLNVNVKSFWENDQQHINIEFQTDGEDSLASCKAQVKRIMETYEENELPNNYILDSFWADGNITVKITFEEDSE